MKQPQKSGARVGNIINWKVIINHNQPEIPNAVLVNVLSQSQQFKRESFKLYEGSFDGSDVVIKGNEVSQSDYPITLFSAANGNGESLELKFINSLLTIKKLIFLSINNMLLNQLI